MVSFPFVASLHNPVGGAVHMDFQFEVPGLAILCVAENAFPLCLRWKKCLMYLQWNGLVMVITSRNKTFITGPCYITEEQLQQWLIFPHSQKKMCVHMCAWMHVCVKQKKVVLVLSKRSILVHGFHWIINHRYWLHCLPFCSTALWTGRSCLFKDVYLSSKCSNIQGCGFKHFQISTYHPRSHFLSGYNTQDL